jgi:plastocyanin
MEDLMHRFGERLMYGAPLLFALLGACSSESVPLTATPTTDAGTGAEVSVPTDAAAAVDTGTAVPSTVTVAIPVGATGQGPAAYGVNPLVITVGTTVQWVNNDSIVHTATSDTGAFDSGILIPGGTFSFMFMQAGTFPYHCTIHGAASMSGTIRVQ